MLPSVNLNREMVDTYISMNHYCRTDMRRIDPGWGYVGPVKRGKLTFRSKDIKAHGEDFVDTKDLLKAKNWESVESINDFAVQALYSFTTSRKTAYYPAWIPSNLDGILISCQDLISTTGYEITKVIMEPTNLYNLKKVAIGFELDDEIKCIGQGNSFLSSAIKFYKEAWSFNYDFHRPSISDIKAEVYITNSYRGEPTIEFTNLLECRREMTRLARYGKVKNLSPPIISNGNYGKLYLMEGEFNIVATSNSKNFF